MAEPVSRLKQTDEFITNDASFLTSDEDIALHIMHRFNIDIDTIETMPAFDEPLKPLFWPNKK